MGNPQEQEKALAQAYLDAAILAREVSTTALEQALKDAKAGNLRDPAKTAMNAAITSGTLLDKRLVIEGRPTAIVQHNDPKQAASQLARKLNLVIDSTAEEIPAPQPAATPNRALIGEGESAKRAPE